ncbi:PREDICTED: BI1-like protein [Ipomoea nil]|uniref:BI1-like protein n=1 Tax=Ipomoea nil TaxID=35883 RepID=UPI00090155CC|nr:PREDICTED: BI1-like protein [Ipomoea nil]
MYGFERVSSSYDGGMKGDIEEGTLYPGIGYGENQLRWGFIRKVYGIISAQILLTTLVAGVTVLYAPLNEVLKGSSALLLFLVFLPFLLLWPLHVYQQRHPLNFIFLGLFTASLSFPVAVSCANTDGAIVLEALILTSAVVLALTGYTFWAAKKGKDFNFLGPILFTSLFILILTGFIQMFFPLGSASTAVLSAVSAIIFSGYIVYDTDNLIKRFTYDEYIWASVTLYLDILNLFLTILRMLKQAEN